MSTEVSLVPVAEQCVMRRRVKNPTSAQQSCSFPDLVQLALVGQTGRLATVGVGARIQTISARRHVGNPLGPLVVRDDRTGEALLGRLEPDHRLFRGGEGGGERFNVLWYRRMW